jgi:hypothetical protein
MIMIGKNWLIIWDNVEKMSSIRPYISKSATAASMLVTTRYSEQASIFQTRGTVMSLDPFNFQESEALFAKLLGEERVLRNDPNERKASSMILTKLGGLALGICTMAIRIRSLNLSVQNFLMRYEKGLPSQITTDGSELEDYDLNLDTVWHESFSNLRSQANKTGFEMLGIIMFLSPDRIPKNLFLGERLETLNDVPTFFYNLNELSTTSHSLIETSGQITNAQ